MVPPFEGLLANSAFGPEDHALQVTTEREDGFISLFDTTYSATFSTQRQRWLVH